MSNIVHHGKDKRGQQEQNTEPLAVAGRVPPHDLDAEACVLAAILLEKDALDHVVDILKPQHFYSDANKAILEAAIALTESGTPVDIQTVASWLRSRERIEKVGGPKYLVQLVDATPSVANVSAYAMIVFELWRLRQLIGKCQRIAAEGYGDVGTVQDFIDQAEHQIYLLARVKQDSSSVPIKQAIQQVFQQITDAAARGQRITGTPTGYERLDARTAGLHSGDLTIVAARPGMGKTSFVLNIAVNVASPRQESMRGSDGTLVQQVVPGFGVAVFSLEMPREQLASRMVCTEGGVDLGMVRQGMIDVPSWRRLTESANRLSSLPIWVDDTPAINLLEMRAKVRRIQSEYSRQTVPGQQENKIGLVVVDYLQLMRGSDKVQGREQEISEISRGLKQLAKELKVPVIALSQLNRQVEQRQDKRPGLADLRESGAIEQDADTIMFIYRDEYYNPKSDRAGLAEIIIAKQRNGPTGKVLLRFTSSYTRFSNLAPADYDVAAEDDE
ncbi:replicative DNA helicase [Candidatus Dependentiae bacterium]|nr:MAG: replicative DNA helicase [Candidatus Dependentiae bacterium]